MCRTHSFASAADDKYSCDGQEVAFTQQVAKYAAV